MTLRLWDGRSGACLAVLQGHNKKINGVMALPNGGLVSWSVDKTYRLWDSLGGKCLEIVAEDHVASRHPEWFDPASRHPEWFDPPQRAGSSDAVGGKLSATSEDFSVRLGYEPIAATFAAWHTDSIAWVCCNLPDGTLVVTLDSGQVCILKLYHGQRRISLAEAEVVLSRLQQAGD
jgi:WD40 repeat protein